MYIFIIVLYRSPGLKTAIMTGTGEFILRNYFDFDKEKMLFFRMNKYIKIYCTAYSKKLQTVIRLNGSCDLWCGIVEIFRSNVSSRHWWSQVCIISSQKSYLFLYRFFFFCKPWGKLLIVVIITIIIILVGNS